MSFSVLTLTRDKTFREQITGSDEQSFCSYQRKLRVLGLLCANVCMKVTFTL